MEKALAVAMPPPAKLKGCSRSSAKFVLVAISKWVSFETGGGAWPSQRLLAEVTYLSTDRVARILRQLVASGYLVQHRPANPRRPAVYGLPAWIMAITGPRVTRALSLRQTDPEGVPTLAQTPPLIGPDHVQDELWADPTRDEVPQCSSEKEDLEISAVAKHQHHAAGEVRPDVCARCQLDEVGDTDPDAIAKAKKLVAKPSRTKTAPAAPVDLDARRPKRETKKRRRA